MLIIRSFLILSALWFLMACATYNAIQTKIHEFTHPPVNTERKLKMSYFSPSSGCGWIGDDQPIMLFQQDTIEKIDAVAWKKKVCGGNGPLIRYDFNIRAVVPPAPKGILVTDAAAATDFWRQKMDETVATFFEDNMSQIVQTRPERMHNCPAITYYVLISKNGTEFEKDQRDRIYQTITDKNLGRPEFMYVRLLGEQRIYLVERSAIKQGANTALYGSDNDRAVRLPGFNKNPILLALDATKAFQSKTELVPPLAISYLGDLHIMSHDFVMIRDGEVDIANAVKNRTQLFKKYLRENTHIQINQTDDPNIVDYKVSLDLGNFCKYSRPVSDFYTK